MHTQWIERLDLATKEALKLVERTAGESSSAWIDLPLARLKDAGERINSLKAAAAELRGRGSRQSIEIGVPLWSSEDGQIRKFDRYTQLNALRIAVIDLNEICEDLTQSYWICALGFQSRGSSMPVIDQVMRNDYLKKGLRNSCGALLSEGHSHLKTLRNALSHFPFTEYAARVISEEPTAPIQTKFKLAQVAQTPQNHYYDDIFNPFCQLGERRGSGEHDFSRSNRNGLNACLFSAGRLAADMAVAFQTSLMEFNRKASSTKQ